MALLGVAYRFDSEDTRNSPTLVLAQALLDHGADVVLHDPYVQERDQNLAKTKLTSRFTTDLDSALAGADVIFLCTAHGSIRSIARRSRIRPQRESSMRATSSIRTS